MSEIRTSALVLALIRARARRLSRWMEHLWSAGETSPDQGQAIGAGEVARLLAPHASRESEAVFLASLPDEQAAVAGAASALAQDTLWASTLGTFGLAEAEADLLALLLAVELDPGLSRVVAYLHDDGRLTAPTPWLSARLAGREPTPFHGAALRRWMLAAPLDGAAPERLASPWGVDPGLASVMDSGQWCEPVLADAAIPVEIPVASALPVIYPDALAQLSDAPDPRDVEIVGAPGSGRQTLAAHFAASKGTALLAVDLRMLTDGERPCGPILTRAIRQAAMTGSLAYFRDAEGGRWTDWTRARRLGPPYLRGVRHPTGEARPIVLAPLPIERRLALWRHATADPPPEALLAQRLTPAEIARAATRPGGAEASLKSRGPRPDHALMAQLPTPYVWDDLVLPDDVAAQLRAFESQVRLRWTVYENWGFARLTHLGQGISALFGGPSGTGKTMAAQVVARSLGLDLLRVDLAGVVNKYIGETEKKLREVFDACEDSGALLFFDEADALFGNRTQVKDAHDRFANIEIDYLLQRIECFDGVAVLATNRRQDLDPAFVRRLRFVIEFVPPRADERLALWRRALVRLTPSGEEILGDIDFDYLAQRLIMTGAEIKSTGLGAAFLARAENARIEMRHLLAAAQREMAKQGQRLRAPVALKESLREAAGE
jgi:ATPase family associated with various cellular activities (AAA)